ncbi:MAG TPA: type II toxin-antitoxin system HicA family toxin [Actinomycetota bacterium]|nr:type II toxin-antitoxin system HicA family toxin [Actinomycetota bacterium]
MTKRRDLGAHLRASGCELVRHGGRHDIWRNMETDKRSSVPRHTDIPRTTAAEICKQLGVSAIERGS